LFIWQINFLSLSSKYHSLQCEIAYHTQNNDKRQRATAGSPYHQDDQHEKDNWNDDVDGVEERFAIQINSELDARIVDTQVRAEAAMTMNTRPDHLPYIYKSHIT